MFYPATLAKKKKEKEAKFLQTAEKDLNNAVDILDSV